MRNNSTCALLIVGHGSTVNPDSSAPTLAHAAEIRRRKIFAEVDCAFWKEEPSLRDALSIFPDAREVYVVPNFISEGYFTQTVIPRELELTGRISKRRTGQLWKYCEPVGNDPGMTQLLLKRAHEIAPNAPEKSTTLIIAAHGTDLNENSAVAAKREADKIRKLDRYASVLNLYMEEPPLISDWSKLTKAENVVVVPFFISDGLHSYEDIPIMLGIVKKRIKERRLPSRRGSRRGRLGNRPSLRDADDVFRQTPYKIDNRSLYYAGAIGTEPQIAEIIINQVARCDSGSESSPPIPDSEK
jgi:sirohydrochlorin cobaltochelatase